MDKGARKGFMQLMICVGLLCVIWGGYFLLNGAIETSKHRQITLRSDNFSWVYQMDFVEEQERKLVLQGFAFKLDSDAFTGAFEIILHDIDSGENYFPKMEYMERNDVNDYFLCEYNYAQSGFKATINAKKLELESRNYEILLRETTNENAYRTKTYVADGKLVYANPNEYVALDVKGTDLENVVENGALRVYLPDSGMYVYQYNDELFWIAEQDYGFVEGDTHVQYQLYTTQNEKLPQERLDNGWLWDNITFKFSLKELTEWNTGKYRVTKKALPKEYSITKIQTGNYIDEWIWLVYFRPLYVFDGVE